MVSLFCWYNFILGRLRLSKKDVMLSSVEAWWVGICAQPFDGAQGDSPF